MRVPSGAVATKDAHDVLITRKPGPSRARRVLRGVALVIGLIPPFWPFSLGTWLYLRRRPHSKSLRLVRQAIADLDRGNIGIAVKKLQEAHFLDPNNSDALYWLGLVMSAQDRPADAIEALSLVAERIPGLPEVETALTDAYLDSDKPEAALFHAQRLFDSAPYDTNSILKLAEALTASGQNELAIRTLTQAPLYKTRLSRDLIRVHYELGRLLQEAGEEDKARDHYERVYTADAKFEDVASRLGSYLKFAGLLILLAGCAPEPVEPDDGFRPIFDGASFDGWRGLGRDTVPAVHWHVEDGMIRKVASGGIPRAADGQVLDGGDLMTIERFSDFELRFEWKVAPGANSGVKYNVSEAFSTSIDPPFGALGFEYQVLDDDRHVDAEIPSHRTGSLYDLIAAPDTKPLRPPGEFNQSRLIWSGGHGEHWLNGEMVVSYDIGTPRFDSLFAASKYASLAEMNTTRAGHIVLQDHGDDVWFRNLRIKTLPR